MRLGVLRLDTHGFFQLLLAFLEAVQSREKISVRDMNARFRTCGAPVVLDPFLKSPLSSFRLVEQSQGEPKILVNADALGIQL